MHTAALHYAPAALVWRAGAWLQRTAKALDAWLCERAKSRGDAQALEAMSDRELRDIGLCSSRRAPRFPTDAWVRDWSN